MTDIVKVLRGEELFPCKANAVEEIRCGRGDCTCDMLKMEKAAAEIERLRDAIKVQANAVRMLQASEDRQINVLKRKENDASVAISTLESEREANATLTDEIERLRWALDFILGVERINDAHVAARAALGEGK